MSKKDLYKNGHDSHIYKHHKKEIKCMYTIRCKGQQNTIQEYLSTNYLYI